MRRPWIVASIVGLIVGLPLYVFGGLILFGIIYGISRLYLLNGFSAAALEIEDRQKSKLSEEHFANWWFVKNSLSVDLKKSHEFF